MSWSARQYIAFEDERTRPVRDLLSALPEREARSVIDLGCGPGNSTEVLAARFPGATVSGIDSSPDMIAAARARLPLVPFSLGGIEEWEDAGPFDVILANAVLHWVPDHATLLPSLVGRLGSGGGLRGAHTPWRCKWVLRIAASSLQSGGCVADDLSSSAAGRRCRGRGMVQGERAAALSRTAERGVARGVCRTVHGGHCAGLSRFSGWFGVAAVPEIVHGGYALGKPVYNRAPIIWSSPHNETAQTRVRT